MSDRKNCPARSVETILKVITKRWTLQILFDMFCGKKHFNEFQEDKPKLLNKSLSRRLQELEEHGLIKKEIKDNTTEYYLTDEGRLLNKVIYELMMYSIKRDVDGEYFSEDTKEYMIKEAKKQLNID